jgi:hypothetical protein
VIFNNKNVDDIFFFLIGRVGWWVKTPIGKIGPSEVRATSGQHLGGHYFA